jgi:hypothetical protein
MTHHRILTITFRIFLVASLNQLQSFSCMCVDRKTPAFNVSTVFSFTDAGSRRHTTHDAITLCDHARKVVNMIVFTPVSARVERLTTFHAFASMPNNTCWVPISRQEHWNLIGTNTPGLRPVDSRHFDDRHPVLRMRTPCLVASAVLGRFALSALHV